MAEQTINVKISLRNDSAANWASKNPILSEGELGVEIDTHLIKVGDGTTNWKNLSYINSTKSNSSTIADNATKADKLKNGLVVKDANNQTITFNGSSNVDLSNGVYYAVTCGTVNSVTSAATAETANKIKNAITFKNKNNIDVSFDGSSTVDLSTGVYYAETAENANTVKTAVSAINAINDSDNNKISTTYLKLDGTNAMTGSLVLNASSNSFLYSGDKFNFAGNVLATGNVYLNYTAANTIKDYIFCNGNNAGTLAELKASNLVGNWNGHTWDEISSTYVTKADMEKQLGDIETQLKTIVG